MSRRSSRDYQLGAEAGAVAGLAVGVLSSFYSMQEYGLVITIVVTVLEEGVLGLTLGAAFVFFCNPLVM